jgi:hypothetical protein
MSITFAAAVVSPLGDEAIIDSRGLPSVNVSSTNGATLLDLLGLELDDFDAPAEDFLGRVLLAQALTDTAGDDDNGLPAVSETRWSDFGRRPGYVATLLNMLREVATWAREHDAVMCWS